jgi:iron complex outermembrane receptor protein
MDIEVTSVSRRTEHYAHAAAAITVITQEDIRRSGATSIPEVLRLATGLHVARFDGRTWAISARGFNISTANKMQVLMDGRSLYTPLFSGVFWDVQDTVLADIDRIEVIRGPGATLWGANAVNGVINIITRSAADSQGSLLVLGAGNEDVGSASFRYGARLGRSTYYKAYSKYFYRDSSKFSDGASARDPMRQGQAGFRTEWHRSERSTLTVQGDGYVGLIGLFDRPDTDVSGGNLLARWNHKFERRGEMQTQIYYDRTDRSVPRQFDETRNTLDVEFQHSLRLKNRHALVWGLGYRVTSDRVLPSEVLFFEPERRTSPLWNAFAEDEITIIPDRLYVSAGSKFEYNDFTGFEFQPNARFRWTLRPSHMAWGAVSRAVRMPTRFDDDLRFTGLSPFVLLRGDRGFVSEKVLSYELGYRAQPSSRMYFDVATFYNFYRDIRSQEAPPGGGIPVVLDNNLRARTYGAEVGASLQITSWLRGHAGYTYLGKHVWAIPGSRDQTGGSSEGNDPRNQLVLRAYMDLPARLELDGIYRHISTLPTPRVPGYSELDVRFGWRASSFLEFSITGRNLWHPQHPEFGTPVPRREEFERSVHGKVIWRL